MTFLLVWIFVIILVSLPGILCAIAFYKTKGSKGCIDIVTGSSISLED